MEIPAGFYVVNGKLEWYAYSTLHRAPSNKQYVLQLRKNLYRVKQAGRNRFLKLRQRLLDRGFPQGAAAFLCPDVKEIGGGQYKLMQTGLYRPNHFRSWPCRRVEGIWETSSHNATYQGHC